VSYSSRISSGDTGININHEIYAAQIRALYQHTPMVLAVNVANSALVAVVLGSYLEQTRWWIFFGLVVTLTGLRAIGWICYRHDRQPYENHGQVGDVCDGRIESIGPPLGSRKYFIAF